MKSTDTQTLTDDQIFDSICVIVKEEMVRATEKFGPFNSPHEGYAVIKEELEELWDDIKVNSPRYKMMEEATQIAAMAIRFIYDLCIDKETL